MKITLNTALYVLGIFLLAGCASSNYQISNSNLADLYRETEKVIKPEIRVYHVDDNTSELSFRLESRNLLYTKTSDKSPFRSRVKITYMLFESFNSSFVSDSASVMVQDENEEMVNKELTGKLKLEAKYPNKYVLKVVVRDMNQGVEESTFLTVDKTSRVGRQNFRLRDSKHNGLLFSRTFGETKTIKVSYNDHMVKRLVVKYYDREFPMTPPPFVIHSPKRFNFTPDSMFYVTLDKENAFDLLLNKEGMYHIQVDSNSKEGLTLIRFENNFPDLRIATQMVEPLRFVTTNREYEAIMDQEFPRDGVEEYWLRVSSSPDRARELIREYYNRVEESNVYFTTHLEGWKTDRGIIYIVFGPPDVIYKNAQGESWIYGNGKNQPQITYNFNLTYNPFSDNDLRLERNPEYKTYWYKAVDTWRQGRIYKY